MRNPFGQTSSLLGYNLQQLDFSFNDLRQSNVSGSHAGNSGDQRSTTAVELTHSLGYEIDEDLWVIDDFGSFVNELTFHRE
jgi:hypothetical protein